MKACGGHLIPEGKGTPPGGLLEWDRAARLGSDWGIGELEGGRVRKRGCVGGGGRVVTMSLM
jgi:hypothetical protein